MYIGGYRRGNWQREDREASKATTMMTETKHDRGKRREQQQFQFMERERNPAAGEGEITLAFLSGKNPYTFTHRGRRFSLCWAAEFLLFLLLPPPRIWARNSADLSLPPPLTAAASAAMCQGLSCPQISTHTHTHTQQQPQQQQQQQHEQ